MALVADSFHMLSDIAALLIAFLSGTPTYTMSRLLTYSLLQKSWSNFLKKWGSGSRLYHHKYRYSLFLISVIFLIYQQKISFEGRVRDMGLFCPFLFEYNVPTVYLEFCRSWLIEVKNWKNIVFFSLKNAV